MGLTAEDVASARAVWEEWAAGSTLRLEINVQTDTPPSAVTGAGGRVEAVIGSAPFLHLQVWQGDRRVFEQRCACDGDVLRRSVRALAMTVAAS